MRLRKHCLYKDTQLFVLSNKNITLCKTLLIASLFSIIKVFKACNYHIRNIMPLADGMKTFGNYIHVV